MAELSDRLRSALAGLFRLYDVFLSLAPTYRRLGELYEERGDAARAKAYYGRWICGRMRTPSCTRWCGTCAPASPA